MTKPADGKIVSNRWGERVKRWVPVVGVTVLAAALRFLFLADIPPGLYHDEAFNGLDALGILEGEHSVYFAANRGREPLFIYLIAATVKALGRTPGALRLAAAICGTLTVPAAYLVARTWFNERVALLSSAILATTYWHVQLSRIGFRAITLPLAIALVLWAGGRAFHSGRRWLWLLTGILYGASFYTYVAVRFTPVAVVGLVVYLLLAGERDRLWPGGAFFLVGTLVTLLPLGAYALREWEAVMGRPGQVSVFNPLIHEGDLPGTLGHQLLRTLGMFFVRGDTIPRHNLPGRPVFDPLMACAMILGTGLAVGRARRRELPAALTLIWVGLMLAPTWLAEDAPHFLRAVGVLPLLTVLPALGLDAARNWVEDRGWHVWSSVLMVGVVGISLAATSWDYFVRYPARPDTLYAFEDAAVQMATEVNTFLGSGWDGNGLAASPTAAKTDHQVYVDRRVWDEWTSSAFLIPVTEQVTVFSPGAPPAPGKPAMLVVWPHDGLEAYTEALPRNSRIAVEAGPLTRGDLEKSPYTAYVSYVVTTPPQPPADAIITFDDAIALVDYTLETRNGSGEVAVEWMAVSAPRDNCIVSVSLFDGDRFVAQDDSAPGDGYYPTRLWRPGDFVVDRHLLEIPEGELNDPRLMISLYVWPTMEPLGARDSNGVPLGRHVSLPITTGRPNP